MKFAPTAFSGRFQPAPIAVVAQALRCAWARVAEIGAGERRMLEDAVGFSGELGGLADRNDAPHRIFRAPGLVYEPPASGHHLRRRRPAGAPQAADPAAGRGSRSSDRFSR